MDDVTFNISGLDALNAKLASVKDDVKVKGGRFALRKAATLIAQRARENALRLDDPETAESIARNIVVRFNGRRFKVNGDIAFRVGILGGAKQYVDSRQNRRKGRVGGSYYMGDKSNPGGDTWYWRFLEFGTSKIAAKPFMRPALENNMAAAADMFVSEYSKAITRAIARAGNL